VNTGYIILETGEVFPGRLIGNITKGAGEIVFNTSMTGYQEILTDPSYSGQMIVFSYPLMGNFILNKNDDDFEKLHVRGIVTGELGNYPNSFDEDGSLVQVLEKSKIPCITNVDTRALVKTIRKRGTVKAIITNHVDDKPIIEHDEPLVKQVTTKMVQYFENHGPHVVLLDFGYKKSILDYLIQAGCSVTVVPFDYTLENIKNLNPDGIVISNGPGNPMNLQEQFSKINILTKMYPTLGISLGHQLIALAYGAKTEKLPFGHRGSNHPVKDLQTGKVFITSQNHGYVVIDQTIDQKEFNVTFQHVNDKTIEGLSHKYLPILTVQFHPESALSQKDTGYIFGKFISTVKNNAGVMSYAIR
jgi:carbamoyl-phosphate synthase small subunit